ncbi:MAG: hypothetical protein ACRYHA_23605 [Janthinobacterium lividum]
MPDLSLKAEYLLNLQAFLKAEELAMPAVGKYWVRNTHDHLVYTAGRMKLRHTESTTIADLTRKRFSAARDMHSTGQFMNRVCIAANRLCENLPSAHAYAFLVYLDAFLAGNVS